MDPLTMVVAIVGIVTVGSIVRARMGSRKDARGNALPPQDVDSVRMREEVKALKERVAVLERLVTDTNGSLTLDREIEKLRSGDRV